jgi:hypothetical protein
MGEIIGNFREAIFGQGRTGAVGCCAKPEESNLLTN